MKTLFALVGFATSCILSGCAHDTHNKTASKPAAVAPTVVTFTNIGTAPLNYQWSDGSLPATNNTVTNAGNWHLEITDKTSVATVTNLQGATFSVVTNTGMMPLSYRWYYVSTNIFVGPSYSIQLPKSYPDTNYWLQTTASNECTNYSMLILKPSPDTNYCLQIIEPNEGTNYALQIIHE